MKTAFEMTYTVSGGALNSTQTKPLVYSLPSAAAAAAAAAGDKGVRWARKND